LQFLLQPECNFTYAAENDVVLLVWQHTMHASNASNWLCVSAFSNVKERTKEGTRNSGKNYFAYFPYVSHLSEVLEPNLMELTSFNTT
jgi:hypothetical protein